MYSWRSIPTSFRHQRTERPIDTVIHPCKFSFPGVCFADPKICNPYISQSCVGLDLQTRKRAPAEVAIVMGAEVSRLVSVSKVMEIDDAQEFIVRAQIIMSDTAVRALQGEHAPAGC